jgi:DNA-binding XRE family transcriptional regulator
MIKKKIDELLKKNGMTFGSLADKIGVKRTTLLYHLSNSKIPLKYIIQIAKVFEVEYADMFEENEVDIRGFIKYKNDYYDLNYINDFVAFIDILAKDCNVETDLFYEPENEIIKE